MINSHAAGFSFTDFGRLLLQHRRKASLYGLCFIVLSLNCAVFMHSNMQGPVAESMLQALQLGCFMVMGIINTWFLYQRNFLAELSLSGNRLAFIGLVFIAMQAVLFTYYYFTDYTGMIMAFAGSGAFLLPFIVYHGWNAYLQIPARHYQYWQLPDAVSPPAALAQASSRLMQVQLAIYRKVEDQAESHFPLFANAKLKLGRVFEQFVAGEQLHSSTGGIITHTEKGRCAWLFFERRWKGLYRRQLNPHKSLVENNIRSNALIEVVRMAGAA
jgi:Type VI secretion system, TssN